MSVFLTGKIPVSYTHLDVYKRQCYKCIKAGFSSIMFDGSHLPIEENIEKTKELVAVCKGMGMSLEAEVGSIGGEEDGLSLIHILCQTMILPTQSQTCQVISQRVRLFLTEAFL